MAITQAMCASFKAEVLLSVHDFRASGDTFKLALYTSSATLDESTTTYSATNESSGTGYSAGGAALTNVGVATGSNAGWTDFSDLTFSSSTITARGALIYNNTPSATDNSGAALTNAAVCVLDFGSDKSSSSGDFTIVFPASAYNTAIIRIA